MEPAIEQALKKDKTIDITTTGRKSGQPRRIEIWFHNIDDRIFITGLPGHRDWYANLLANPTMTFHLKESLSADLPACAVPITFEKERRKVLTAITSNIDRDKDLEKWVSDSPLVEILFVVKD